MRAKTVTLHHESRLSSRLGRVFDRNVNIITKALITIRYFCELRMPLNSSPPQVKTLWDHCLTCLAATLLHCKLKPSVARITTFVTNLSRTKIQCCKLKQHLAQSRLEFYFLQQILVLLLVLPLKLQLVSQQIWLQRLWLAVSEARLRGKLKKKWRTQRTEKTSLKL